LPFEQIGVCEKYPNSFMPERNDLGLYHSTLNRSGVLMNIHLAGPLFCEAQQNWLRDIKERILGLEKQLNKKVEVISPYELLRTLSKLVRK